MKINSQIAWRPDYELGEAGMDAAHHEFIDIVANMIDCPETEFAQQLELFRIHAERHFGDEDQMMQEGYTSAQCHLDEHAAVLKSTFEVQALVRDGNFGVGRRFATELAHWFPEHTIAMDRGLADWALKKRLGGARMVFKRPGAD